MTHIENRSKYRALTNPHLRNAEKQEKYLCIFLDQVLASGTDFICKTGNKRVNENWV
jgi:hypothetical protein